MTTRSLAMLCLLAGATYAAAWGSGTLAQQPSTPPSPAVIAAPASPAPRSAAAAAAASQPPGREPREPTTTAERIARLRRTIEMDEQRLAELQGTLTANEDEFRNAGERFGELDGRRDALAEPLEAARADEDADRVRALERELEPVQERWQLSRERFDLAIEARRVTRERIEALQEKIASDRRALSRLTGTEDGIAAEPPAPSGRARPAAEEATQDPPRPLLSPFPAIENPLQPQQEAAEQAQSEAEEPTPEQPSPEVTAAQQEAQRAAVSAEQAAEQLQQIDERLAALERNIELEQQARQAAQRALTNAEETVAALDQQFQTLLDQGAPAEELRSVREQLREAGARVAAAQAEIDEHSADLERLQADRNEQLGDKVAATEAARQEAIRAAEAKQTVEQLSNPFSPQNIYQWLLTHGAKVVVILGGMFILLWTVNVASYRMVKILMQGERRGTHEERENRATTLAGVFTNFASVAIYVGACLMLLEVIGIPVGPLLGGAAVIGLAVAFGAQNLIKDYFAGIMILLENQYGVNNVVKIGDTVGLVERITLRMTAMRDLEGIVHFIPHGQITTVSNLTFGWSRALLDIGVSYNEDADHVMDVLMQIGRELRQDPKFADLILEDPEMLGVDQLADSAVVIKLFIKTRPLEKWTVKREMLRRVKKRFDELGIEIPYPHRTVYHRHESEDGLDKALRPRDTEWPMPH
ncbi:MAG: mechanosensitive ion channel domain-containing protein [Pirellulales bacterium]